MLEWIKMYEFNLSFHIISKPHYMVRSNHIQSKPTYIVIAWFGLLLLYATSTVFQSYRGSNVMYEMR